jgi:Ca2+-binding RTX toxin-like protein
MVAPTDDTGSLDFGISGDPVTAPTDDIYTGHPQTTMPGYNYIVGTNDNDIGLFGTSGNDFISGLMGDDCLYGKAGDDYLVGSRGSDVMAGGVGNDSYVILGSDVVFEWGGEGHDTVYVYNVYDGNGHWHEIYSSETCGLGALTIMVAMFGAASARFGVA